MVGVNIGVRFGS